MSPRIFARRLVTSGLTRFARATDLVARAVRNIGKVKVKLKPGALAPDFSLAPRDGGAPIGLSSFRGKMPVALVFGSYT